MLWLLELWLLALGAQVVVPVREGTPAGFQFDGAVGEWGGPGELHLAMSKEGLWVAGRAGTGPLRIWLAGAQPLVIPSFGKTNAAQVAYRRNLAKLFEREFLCGESVEEVLATKAHEVMGDQSLLDFPHFRSMVKPQIERAGQTFEALIPWGAFPPLAGPVVDRLRLRINGRAFQARLTQPLKFQFSECGYSLHNKWYYPTASGLIHDSLEFVEPVSPRRGVTEEMSPLVVERSVYEQRIGDGEFLCGPQLAWIKAGRSAFSKLDVAFEPEFRRMVDGSLLVKSGPGETKPPAAYVKMDGGVALEIIRIGPDGTFNQLLRIGETVAEGFEVQIRVSEDWGTVTVYRHDPVKAEWNTEIHCGGGAEEYRRCGGGKSEGPQ